MLRVIREVAGFNGRLYRTHNEKTGGPVLPFESLGSCKLVLLLNSVDKVGHSSAGCGFAAERQDDIDQVPVIILGIKVNMGAGIAFL